MRVSERARKIKKLYIHIIIFPIRREFGAREREKIKAIVKNVEYDV